MGSVLTAFFSKLRALLWKIACLAYLTPEFSTVRVFHCLKETKGRAVEIEQGRETHFGQDERCGKFN